MSLVYKACKNSVVTLELLSDSITNEQRDGVVDSNFAKFRTNKVKVISIINPETDEQLDKDCSVYDHNFVYKDGQIIKTIFERNINMICGGGIHYFKTYEGALSWYYRDHIKTNGKCNRYYDNGQKELEYNYKDGKIKGKLIRWGENGLKWSEHNYKDGQKDGKQEGWYDRQKQYEYHYKDGKKDGKQEEWHENGQKSYKCNHKDGEMNGKYEGWDENGRKLYECNYKDGMRDGKQEWYYRNGQKSLEYYQEGHIIAMDKIQNTSN